MQAFSEALGDMFSLLSAGKHSPDARHTALWFKVLAPYPLDAVTRAMTAHLRAPSTGRTLPIPADIVSQIDGAAKDDGRPGADEAWSIALTACDEGATVVWSDEISGAWLVARPVLDAGDETGARLAFRSAYERLCAEARANGSPLAWSASLGHDLERRAMALDSAKALGRSVAMALPAPSTLRLGLSELAASATCPPHVRQRLMAIADELRSEKASHADVERARTQALKDASAAAVASYIQGKDA